MFQPPGISSSDFFSFLQDTSVDSLVTHDNWPRMRRPVIRIQRSHGTIKSVQDPNGNLCGPLIMNKMFRNMAGVKKHTTTNKVIVLEGEQHLLHLPWYPVSCITSTLVSLLEKPFCCMHIPKYWKQEYTQRQLFCCPCAQGLTRAVLQARQLLEGSCCNLSARPGC